MIPRILFAISITTGKPNQFLFSRLTFLVTIISSIIRSFRRRRRGRGFGRIAILILPHTTLGIGTIFLIESTFRGTTRIPIILTITVTLLTEINRTRISIVTISIGTAAAASSHLNTHGTTRFFTRGTAQIFIANTSVTARYHFKRTALAASVLTNLALIAGRTTRFQRNTPAVCRRLTGPCITLRTLRAAASLGRGNTLSVARNFIYTAAFAGRSDRNASAVASHTSVRTTAAARRRIHNTTAVAGILAVRTAAASLIRRNTTAVTSNLSRTAGGAGGRCRDAGAITNFFSRGTTSAFAILLVRNTSIFAGFLTFRTVAIVAAAL